MGRGLIARCALYGSALIILLLGDGASAATVNETLNVDLAPLIDQAAQHPERFAVEIPHPVSTSSSGAWSTTGARSVWRYSLQIPGAVSMSFHATPVRLPPDAQLKVTAGGSVYSYGPKDVHRAGIWSRIARGDTLAFELSAASAEIGQLEFSIVAFQAGYRGLGAGVPNHPHYDKLQLRNHDGAQSCTENWSCHTDSVDTGPGQSTVAIVIDNVGQCSGVLLNDVPGDGKPYVLTARHCESGNPDGGAPNEAGGMTVYWDAVTPCGPALGSIYDPGIPTQYGATTIVEQQDSWLVKLDAPPVVSDAFYAGWDATGGVFVGGFTAHHANGTSRQFVGWYGQASYNTVSPATLGVTYTSTLWATVNAVGSIAPGASGSGLFDATGHLTGVVIRGVSQSGNPDLGVCPVASPPAPSLQSATSLSTAFSGIFSSTADPTSTTGAVTLQSVLDPGNTGTMVLDGEAAPPQILSFAPDSNSGFTGGLDILRWNAINASSCTASGGDSGDGWTGTVAAGGSLALTSYDGGTITYTLTCSNGSRTASAQTQITWTVGTPAVSFTVDGLQAYGVPIQIGWAANVRPCVESGGNAGDGWTGTQPPAGKTSVTETVVGSVTYTMTCGSGALTASNQLTLNIYAPSVFLRADATTLQVGVPVMISAQAFGGPCVTSGGAAGDGWSVDVISNSPLAVTESQPGSYTYVLSCGSGAETATAQVSVTFVNAAPSVSLTASAATVPFLTNVTLNWDANVRPCVLSVTGPSPQSFAFDASTAPHGSFIDSRPALGSYTYTMSCGSGASTAQASTTVTVTGTAKLSVFQGPEPAVAGEQFLVQFQSDLAPCTLSGGATGDGWAGAVPGPNGNINVVEAAAGTYIYGITCGTGNQSLQAQTSVNVVATAPNVTVSTNHTVLGLGQPVTITWNSTVSPCQANGGSAGDGWTGALPTSGSMTLTENSPNLYTYGVSCGTPPLSASGQTSVNFLTVGPPTFSANPTSAQVGQSVDLSWQSSDGSTCTAANGLRGDGWTGSLPASGNVEVRESFAGVYDYILNCGMEPRADAYVTFTAPPPVPLPPPGPSVTLTSNVGSVTAGSPVVLSWTTATVASCTAGGGNTSDGWNGALNATGGNQAVQESTAGSYTYSITCSAAGGSPSATASATVTVNADPTVTVSGSTGGGKSGGGGALDFGSLILLALSLIVRQRGYNFRERS